MKTGSSKKLLLTVLIACLTLTLFAEICLAQGVRPTPTFRNMPARPQTGYFAARRAKFMEQMDAGSIAILAARTTPEGAGVADHKFKQDLSFYYLTGSEMPDTFCLIVPGSIDEFVMFVPPQQQPNRSNTSQSFIRPPMPPIAIPRSARPGVPRPSLTLRSPINPELIYSTEQLQKILPYYLRGKTNVYCNSNDPALRETITTAAQGAAIEFLRPDPIITDMRALKDQHELNLLRRAIDITCQAHIEVLRRAQPGMYEYEIETIIEGTYFRMGSPRPGFTTICGSGPNTYILHYSENTRKTQPDDMIVMDIGAEIGGYTADVTRTIPLDGKFSPEQRDIYEIVLQANQETLAIVKPGLDYGLIESTAHNVLAAGLHRLGFVDDPELRWQVRPWTQHGVSHGIGLNVHESATTTDRYASGRDRGPNLLEVNSIFTVEPGIYISEKALERKPRNVSDDQWNAWVKKVTPLVEKYRYIGVRIEDDVLVTPDGHQIVSIKALKTIEDIERFMNRKQ
ncbi:MAG: M24 family metallopeptidase [Planctomycetes bacterium]|nr:M24 family metallopeptidase [Planctomycetota bacterium]